MSINRMKFGYMSYEDMLTRIEEKKIDVYDLIFEKNTNEFYIISPDLLPCPVRSRVYIFESVLDANTKLNDSTDTYAGQIAAILIGEEYKAYIVNQKQSTGRFYVSPIDSFTGEINYDSLGSRPITNMIGTLDNPINVSKLSTGVYQISGQYIISEHDTTTYLSAKNNLFIVNVEADYISIKKITSNEIIDYAITSESMVSNKIVTTDFLTSQGYVTETYIDEKLAALEAVIKEDTIKYVKENVVEEFDTIIDEKVNEALQEKLDTVIDEKIDQKLDKKIIATSNDDITSLF